MSTRLLRIAIVAVLAGCLAVSACAQETKPDPKAQAVLDQMLAAYKALNALHMKATMKLTGNAPQIMPGTIPESLEMRLLRPNKLWLHYVEKSGAKVQKEQVVSDGTNLWRWQSATNIYTKTKAPGLFRDFPRLPDIGPEMDILFREQNPFQNFPPNAHITLGEPIKVGDTDVDVVEIKIAEEETPFTVAVKLLIGQKDHLMRGLSFEGSGKDPQSGKDLNFKMESTYSLVNAAPDFKTADFVFTPPPGAKPPASGSPPNPKPGGKPSGGAKKKP